MTGQLLPQRGMGEREIGIKLRIRETLFKDAEKLARAVGMPVERFLSEIVETDLAVRRSEEATEKSAREDWT